MNTNSIHIPLEFWFTRKPSVSLPIVALALSDNDLYNFSRNHHVKTYSEVLTQLKKEYVEKHIWTYLIEPEYKKDNYPYYFSTVKIDISFKKDILSTISFNL